MAGVIDFIEGLSNMFSGEVPILLRILFFTLVTVIYAVFVFYFYRFMARKNLLTLNLNQYNNYEHRGLVKFFAAIFYIIEYIILLPILTSFWFVFLAVFLLVLAEGMSVEMILMVSAAIVASVRITAYISEDLSKDLAKMVPFTLIVIAVTKPGFFVISDLIHRFLEIPELLMEIPYYLLFIVLVEFVMRLGQLIVDSSKSEDEKPLYEDSA